MSDEPFNFMGVPMDQKLFEDMKPEHGIWPARRAATVKAIKDEWKRTQERLAKLEQENSLLKDLAVEQNKSIESLNKSVKLLAQHVSLIGKATEIANNRITSLAGVAAMGEPL